MKDLYFILLIIAAFTVAGAQVNAQNGNKLFEFDDFFKNNSFSLVQLPAQRSLKDGENYIVSENRGTKLVVYNYKTGEVVKTLLHPETLQKAGITSFSDFSFNDSETKLLLTTEREAIYRRSFKARYYIYNIADQSIIPLSKNNKQQVATFSPDGTQVAFVRDNNLFLVDLNTGAEIQVTTDGKANTIINGIPDWVYEEEFGFHKAYEWSPDGKYLAWVRFDESKVPLFSMSMFQGMEPALNENKLYPGITTFKYPKAGEANSIVTVQIYNTENHTTKEVNTGTETDIYIPRIRFTQDPHQLAVFKLNRLQNKYEVLLSDAQTGNTQLLFTESNAYYFPKDYADQVRFLDDKKHFTVLSERDGYSHVYIYNMKGEKVHQVTKGNFDVVELNGCDTKKQVVYYTSAEPTPYQRENYSIKWDGTEKKKISTLTGINSIKFSENYNYYSITCSNSKTPPTTQLYQNNWVKIRDLENNKQLNEKLKEYRFNYREFFSFTTSENVNLNGWMLKPYNFDPSKKYPVFMTQYSGPNSQSVMDSWSMGWDNYLAQLGFIVVCVDGRGTGGRGEAFRKATYMQLGKYETLDQIETARYLGTLSYIDAKRIGIFGWSFGGYISTSCLVKGNGIFKAGIAVAPVTNWRYYDNIYTERYMRTPSENPSGYDDNSPINFTRDLQGSFLVCHGLADDNVHVQNTFELSESLVQANKQFEMQIYTNRNHGIRGGNTSYHLYRKMTDFILKNL